MKSKANFAAYIYIITRLLHFLCVIGITISLSGCGSVVNIMKASRTNTSTYLFGEPFSEKINPQTARVYLKSSDLANIGSKQHTEFKEDVKRQLKQNGYTIVESIDQANLIVNVIFKNFGSIDDITLGNLKKYSQYTDATNIMKVNKSSIEMKGFNFEMFDENGMHVADTPNMSSVSRSTSSFSKLLGVDFISGTAIGIALGYVLFLAVPILAPIGLPAILVIGGLFGGLVTSILQTVTTQKNYGGFINVRISVKKSEDFDIKNKLVTTVANNATKEMYEEKRENWMDYHVDVMIVTEASFTLKKAKSRFITTAGYSVGNML